MIQSAFGDSRERCEEVDSCLTVIEISSLILTSKPVAADLGFRIPVAVSPRLANVLQTVCCVFRHPELPGAVCGAGPDRGHDDGPAEHG
jgi:hypothetical protein